MLCSRDARPTTSRQGARGRGDRFEARRRALRARREGSARGPAAQRPDRHRAATAASPPCARSAASPTRAATREATDQTLYCVFSSTKAITSAAAWLLIQEGKLDVRRKVAELVPEFAANGKQDVVIEQLFTHTAGFPHAPFIPDHFLDQQEAPRALRGAGGSTGSRARSSSTTRRSSHVRDRRHHRAHRGRAVRAVRARADRRCRSGSRISGSGCRARCTAGWPTACTSARRSPRRTTRSSACRCRPSPRSPRRRSSASTGRRCARPASPAAAAR